MTGQWSRLTFNLIQQRHWSHAKLLTLLCSEGQRHFRAFGNVRSGDKGKELLERYYQVRQRALTYYSLAFAATATFGYAFHRWNNDLATCRDALSTSLFPAIHAAEKTPTDRDKYNFIADVVEVSAPSVVYIEIQDERRRDYFSGKPLLTSNGSGFIVSEDGLILTNAHVVNQPYSTVKVRLQDGSTYTGVVEAIDSQGDLATVRINKSNCPVMKLGSSSNLRPGEFVVAIGSPLALSNSITSGVISSVNRPSKELGLHRANINYIQTDAAITFGNSGGPLVNLRGEAIGINAMKVTAGISFALPIDYAKDFLAKAEAQRKKKAPGSRLLGLGSDHEEPAKRRYMGITMLTLTPDIIFELQQRYGNIPVSVTHGVLIWKVMVGSPAYAVGLQIGDILTHVNGKPIVSTNDIYDALKEVGTLSLTVLRSGRVLHFNVEPENV